MTEKWMDVCKKCQEVICECVDDGWISIYDRLPELPEKGCVEVIIACYSTVRKIYHVSPAEFQKNKFYDRYNERIHIDDPYWPITHWRPLPEPPK